MPYIVCINKKLETSFPEICPFCEKRKAKHSTGSSYGQVTSVVPGVYIRWNDYEFKLPVCSLCLFILSLTMLLSIAVLVIPWLMVILIMQFDLGSIDLPIKIAAYSSVAAILVIIWRQFKKSKLRIGHVGADTVTYFFRSREYSLVFAELNKSESRFKLFHFATK